MWDLETNEPRRILFGDTKELQEFFIDQSRIIHDRLQKMQGEQETKEEAEKVIRESRIGFEKENAIGAFEGDHVLEITYEIVEKK